MFIAKLQVIRAVLMFGTGRWVVRCVASDVSKGPGAFIFMDNHSMKNSQHMIERERGRVREESEEQCDSDRHFYIGGGGGHKEHHSERAPLAEGSLLLLAAVWKRHCK